MTGRPGKAAWDPSAGSPVVMHGQAHNDSTFKQTGIEVSINLPPFPGAPEVRYSLPPDTAAFTGRGEELSHTAAAKPRISAARRSRARTTPGLAAPEAADRAEAECESVAEQLAGGSTQQAQGNADDQGDDKPPNPENEALRHAWRPLREEPAAYQDEDNGRARH